MLCPLCHQETQPGTMLFMGMTGFAPMVATFIPKSEREKGPFRAKTRETVLMQGLETEAHCCAACGLLMPLFWTERRNG